MNRHNEQEFHGTAIDNPSLFTFELDKFQRPGLANRRLQVMQGVVKLHGHNTACVFLLIICHKVARHGLRQYISCFANRYKHKNAPFLC